ncbi:MAG TPA: ABC transporter substrate-binding protein [Burkholderiales bacterium]|nr:ABC transporter substrate-binding protein [Burkholderiales bacterium]
MKEYRMSSKISAALAFVVAGTIAGSAMAQAGKPFPIRVAQQPQRWAVEWYIATKKGWWEKIGLQPTMSTFASGAPEVAAGAAGSWDVGAAGSIPSVLGAGRYKLQTIAIADEEAAINTIMATKDKADEYLKNPGLLKGKSIPVPLNSTGHWAASVCLEKKFKLKPGEWTFVNLSPAEINAAISSGRYDVTEAWAPNTYQLESTIDARIICSGRDVGLPITSNLFAHPQFAKDHPDIVAKFLALYLRVIAWERAHPKETEQYLGAFYTEQGVNIPPKYLARELKDRPAFTLKEQLDLFKGAGTGKSKADDWLNQVAEFMKSVGTLSKVPDSKEYVTDKFLLMIERDPALKKFAEDSSD